MPTLDPSHQWTLARSLDFEGVALHSGHHVHLTLAPASAGSGLRFIRTDLPDACPIPALAEYVVETTLSTTLGADGVRVQTVEHLMAALWAMGITNADLLIDGPELPVLDGSSLAYVRAIARAGRVDQGVPRLVLALGETVEVTVGDRSVLYQPAQHGGVEITCIVDYNHRHAGPQLFEGTVDETVFCRELAGARTFCFLSEVEAMQRAGLAKGGSTDNAVVIADHGPMSPLRYPDEFVRHKALDLLGDLALCGFAWTGSVVAAKAGHPLHVALAKELRRRALELAPTEVIPHALVGR